MNNRITWISYKGYRFLCGDFSALRNEEDQLKLFDEFEVEIVRSSNGKVVPTIVDITGALMTEAVTKRSRMLLSNIKAKGVPQSPIVMLGASNLQKVAISSISLFRQDIMTADTREEAQKLLVNYMMKHRA
jgi:hypothetical protein